MRFLLIGGAGYVGSHCGRHLIARGHQVEVLDDLSTGHRAAAQGPLHHLDVRDTDAVTRVLQRGFDGVMHFAALALVGESSTQPLRYWDVNVGGTLSLLLAMRRAGCERLVFSSSAAVYGDAGDAPITESSALRPVNPYGRTKLAAEQLIEDAGAEGLRAFRLRYFNAAGAAPDGSLGEAHRHETHLIPLALRAAADGGALRVFGADYPTPDGSCVRDYVHVDDLARAHALALEALAAGHRGGALNLGTGAGASVLEVLRVAEAVSGAPIARRSEARREGDPPSLVASPARAALELGWSARYTLEDAVRHAWAWHSAPRFP
ncbi:MAG: UDP-glucose 4-epimerase GalE [Deltaproteobacteria bacterium]|nr:UDP-glucose 4-epimerase GalE [Deltaproteobacteria bacterium]